MGATNTILSIILAALCAASAVGDFRAVPRVVESLEAVRCPPRLMPFLGAIKSAAAIGLIVGLAVDWLGTVTALCLSIYFLLAVLAHVRVKDRLAGTAPAAVMLGLSVAALVTSL